MADLTLLLKKMTENQAHHQQQVLQLLHSLVPALSSPQVPHHSVQGESGVLSAFSAENAEKMSCSSTSPVQCVHSVQTTEQSTLQASHPTIRSSRPVASVPACSSTFSPSVGSFQGPFPGHFTVFDQEQVTMSGHVPQQLQQIPHNVQNPCSISSGSGTAFSADSAENCFMNCTNAVINSTPVLPLIHPLTQVSNNIPGTSKASSIVTDVHSNFSPPEPAFLSHFLCKNPGSAWPQASNSMTQFQYLPHTSHEVSFKNNPTLPATSVQYAENHIKSAALCTNADFPVCQVIPTLHATTHTSNTTLNSPAQVSQLPVVHSSFSHPKTNFLGQNNEFSFTCIANSYQFSPESTAHPFNVDLNTISGIPESHYTTNSPTVLQNQNQLLSNGLTSALTAQCTVQSANTATASTVTAVASSNGTTDAQGAMPDLVSHSPQNNIISHITTLQPSAAAPIFSSYTLPSINNIDLD